jgi:2-polyprenyl-6-methoxyphenol hydroxylase-like FAD-dependent oxidoreductase
VIRCDALIAGGGPAGLAAAIALRQKGLDVLLADALCPPIDKACGEGLMPDAQKDLAALGIQVTAQDGAAFDGIAFPIRAPLCGRSLRARDRHGYPPLATSSRFWWSAARQLGVRLAWGSRVDAAQNQCWSLDGEPCSYRYAIGADGQSSRVRQSIGLGQGNVLSRRFGARCHYRVRPWSRMVEVHWGELGQAYITPVGPEEICVATVARSTRRPEWRQSWLACRCCGRISRGRAS